MVNWNLGSVAARAYTMIDSIPSTISGTTMQGYADMARIFVQNWTGAGISSTAISEAYQPVITNLTAMYTVTTMEGTGADFDYSIGEFKVTKAGFSQTKKQSDAFASRANWELKALGKKSRYSKVNG